MNKYEILIITGKLEVLMSSHEAWLAELNIIQSLIVDDNFHELSIHIGKLTALASNAENNIIENINKLSEFVTEQHIGNSNISDNEDLSLSVSISNLSWLKNYAQLIERCGIFTLEDLLLTIVEGSLDGYKGIGRVTAHHIGVAIKENWLNMLLPYVTKYSNINTLTIEQLDLPDVLHERLKKRELNTVSDVLRSKDSLRSYDIRYVVSKAKKISIQ